MAKSSIAQPTVRVAVSKAPTGAVLLVRQREAMSFMRPLMDAGYRVVLVEWAEAMIEETMKGGYDVVLCDSRLPGGADALSVVQAYDQDLPLIVLSPAASPALKLDQSVSLFCDMEEPVPSELLLTTVARAVEVRRQRQEIAAENAELGNRPTEPAIYRSAEAPLPAEPYRSVSGARPKAGVGTPMFDKIIATLRIELDEIYDVSELRAVGYEAKVRWNEPPPDLHPAIIRTAIKEDPAVRRYARKAAADAVVKLPLGANLFLDVLPSDLLDAELYAPESPLAHVAERVVLQIRGIAGMPMSDLGPRLSVLRFLGFRIALSDMDTSASGITQLGDFAPEFLKVGVSMTRGLDRDPARKRMVEGLVAMCRVIGTTPIAEGDVTPKERAALLECGCALIQGREVDLLAKRRVG